MNHTSRKRHDKMKQFLMSPRRAPIKPAAYSPSLGLDSPHLSERVKFHPSVEEKVFTKNEPMDQNDAYHASDGAWVGPTQPPPLIVPNPIVHHTPTPHNNKTGESVKQESGALYGPSMSRMLIPFGHETANDPQWKGFWSRQQFLFVLLLAAAIATIVLWYRNRK